MKVIPLKKLDLQTFFKMLEDYYAENNTQATQLFFYSRGQAKLSNNQNNVYFKGIPYSETRCFEHGIDSNWDDMLVLGVGTDNDIEFK